MRRALVAVVGLSLATAAAVGAVAVFDRSATGSLVFRGTGESNSEIDVRPGVAGIDSTTIYAPHEPVILDEVRPLSVDDELNVVAVRATYATSTGVTPGGRRGINSTGGLFCASWPPLGWGPTYPVQGLVVEPGVPVGLSIWLRATRPGNYAAHGIVVRFHRAGSAKTTTIRQARRQQSLHVLSDSETGTTCNPDGGISSMPYSREIPGHGDPTGELTPLNPDAQVALAGVAPAEVLAVGDMQDDVLYAFDPHVVLAAAARHERDHLDAVAVSHDAGSAITAGAVGRYLLYASTDRADLRRITGLFRNEVGLPVPAPLGDRGPFYYGTVTSLDDSTALLVVNRDASIGVYRIDVTHWRVLHSTVIEHRFNPHPHACRLDANTVAVASERRVDLLDLPTLVRRREITLPTTGASAMVCAAGRAYVFDRYRPQGWTLTARGVDGGGFHWSGGRGARRIVNDPVRSQILALDEEAHQLVACPTAGGACRTATIGLRPTSFTIYRDTVIVTDEQRQSLITVDPTTLKVLGEVALPFSPRTITAWRP